MRIALLVTVLCSLCAPAYAKPVTVLNADGKVIGVNNLVVAGTIYDVIFSEGGLSFDEARAATPSSFEFASQSEATAAAIALLAFFNNSAPSVTANDAGWAALLDNSINGDVVIPYAVTSVQVPYVYISWVGNQDPHAWVLSNPFSFEPDRVLVPAATWSSFTRVPEPSTLALLAIGLVGVGGLRQRRQTWCARTRSLIHCFLTDSPAQRMVKEAQMPRLSTVACIAIVGIFTLGPVADAAPITIDFEEMRFEDSLIRFIGPTYSSDGFTFTSSVPSYSDNDPGFITIGALSPSFTGATSLANVNALGGTTLARADGTPFDLFSIDLAETPNFDQSGNPVNLGSFSVTFLGTRANGSTVEATALVGGFPIVTSFKFPGFTNLVSVEWFQGGGGIAGGLTHQFDNVRVQAVPEPGTLALLGIGMLVSLRGFIRPLPRLTRSRRA